MIQECGQFVVQQVVVQRPSGLLVKDQLLRQAEADAHAHTAVDLRLRQGGIDQRTRVVAVDDVQQFRPAHRNIHFNLGNRTAEGVRVGFHLVGALRRNVPAVRQAVERFRGQLAQAHQHPAVCRTDDIPVDDVEVKHRHTCQRVRIVQNLFLQQQPGLADGETCHIGLPGGVGARAERRHIRILG